MKRVLVGIAILAFAQSLSAAIQYEFRQTMHSHLESIPSTDMTGRGVIDGDRSRVEFIAGNGFAAGTYVISTNGSKTLMFVDPSRKTYVEVNAGSVATSIGAAHITVTNKKVNLSQIEEHTMIAGLLNILAIYDALEGPAYEDDEEAPKVEEKVGKVNPIVHFFKSIGIVFGLIFAAISGVSILSVRRDVAGLRAAPGGTALSRVRAA